MTATLKISDCQDTNDHNNDDDHGDGGEHEDKNHAIHEAGICTHKITNHMPKNAQSVAYLNALHIHGCIPI